MLFYTKVCYNERAKTLKTIWRIKRRKAAMSALIGRLIRLNWTMFSRTRTRGRFFRLRPRKCQHY